ncbi:MAG: 3,4-dihydroxy-2-butanone-4-phosphate synthase [Hahellaceae bacterium]|nr:3,4-dihydroxy-2-butanone-4-phosphate synthase [Hahellaceae bacterium]MCP5168848.1 3,4-dihydroxy-2-butanone-4-phosphate synthase [Hahellaceae bacterium]
MELNTAQEIVDDIRQGKMVILMDDEDRENEGDIIIAAECVTAEHINFMARFARGLICMPMTRERCEQLKLPLMVQRNGSGFGTKFTVSIEAAEGVTTGISAADRARTVQVAAGRTAKAEDIVSPGHIFPLMAQPGGVLSRAGHTEAACDLARMGGFEPAGVICEIMNDDGTMARRPELEKFAQEHQLKIGTIADLIHYRTLHEHTIERLHENVIETEHGEFNLITYKDTIQNGTHLVLQKGSVSEGQSTLVRVHVADTLRDLIGALKPGVNSWPLHKALAKVAEEGAGVLVLLDVGEQADLEESISDFFANRRPRTTAATGSGVYLTVGTGSQILRDLGVRQMRLLSSPMKFSAISGFDLEVVEYIPYQA